MEKFESFLRYIGLEAILICGTLAAGIIIGTSTATFAWFLGLQEPLPFRFGLVSMVAIFILGEILYHKIVRQQDLSQIASIIEALKRNYRSPTNQIT